MTNGTADLLITTGVAALCSLPSVALGYWLKKTNRAPNRWIASVLMGICVVLLKLLWLPALPYEWFAVLVLVASTLGVYRTDMVSPIRRRTSKQ